MNIADAIMYAITESIHYDRIEVATDGEDFDTYEELATFIRDTLPGMTEVVDHADQVTGVHDGSAFAIRLAHLI